MDNQVPLAVQNFMGSIATEVLNPVMGVIFAAALFYFLWGLMVFIFSAGDETKIALGKQHMLWGTIGMTIMVSVFGILQIGLNTFDVGINELPDPIPLNSRNIGQ